mmetsp:Transcript_53352/g.79291  ORF Transcript_53352/g.79291 Transcript_53352/m.79291 type:complete len:474 (+) Transcript_53352:149-1570(+)|eukprot:CAMPEP_0195518728 /NCGR_PEP_ID=MMETSP0794_2-20130614/13570_1 /TAXON_ID=515487 /ORGANISM="Stephanopyxis turris, Strain CCMP 815" /LENGTH=473 /DNA_ID=CAMNT_0040647749 /DNA_START=149 /DNA_END=1570 /DNA_ORIENTATION=+
MEENIQQEVSDNPQKSPSPPSISRSLHYRHNVKNIHLNTPSNLTTSELKQNCDPESSLYRDRISINGSDGTHQHLLHPIHRTHPRRSKRTKRPASCSSVSPSTVSQFPSDEDEGTYNHKRRKLNHDQDEIMNSNERHHDDHKYATPDDKNPSDFLRRIPHDVVGDCLSFLSSLSDRNALLRTCRQFYELGWRICMVRNLVLIREPSACDSTLEDGGDFIVETDTKESAVRRLSRYVQAGNLDAFYMMGMIRCYCFDDVSGGVSLLRHSARQDHLRSAYALGIILRDCAKEESDSMLTLSAKAGFLPALQEICSAREMKARHGEPTAKELQVYLDPGTLGRLLKKSYIHDKGVRMVATSHCWNPMCGRWAYKISRSAGSTDIDNNRESCVRVGDPERSNAAVSLFQRYGPQQQLLGQVDDMNRMPGSHQPIQPAALKVARMKMCSSCRRAKYCSKLCQVFDWRSGRHKSECQYL